MPPNNHISNLSPKIIVNLTYTGGNATMKKIYHYHNRAGDSKKKKKKKCFPDGSFSFHYIIYKRFPQVSLPLRTISFENTAFSHNESIWQFENPLQVGKIGDTGIKFLSQSRKQCQEFNTTVIKSHLLMPHVTADGVLLIHFFHHPPDTMFYIAVF